MGHARALVNIEDVKHQLDLYNQIVSSELSVRQVEDAAREKRSSSPGKSASVQNLPQSLKDAIQSLNNKLEVPVELKADQKGKGHLNIRFNSSDELESLLSKLLSE